MYSGIISNRYTLGVLSLMDSLTVLAFTTCPLEDISKTLRVCFLSNYESDPVSDFDFSMFLTSFLKIPQPSRLLLVFMGPG